MMDAEEEHCRTWGGIVRESTTGEGRLRISVRHRCEEEAKEEAQGLEPSGKGQNITSEHRALKMWAHLLLPEATTTKNWTSRNASKMVCCGKPSWLTWLCWESPWKRASRYVHEDAYRKTEPMRKDPILNVDSLCHGLEPDLKDTETVSWGPACSLTIDTVCPQLSQFFPSCIMPTHHDGTDRISPQNINPFFKLPLASCLVTTKRQVSHKRLILAPLPTGVPASGLQPCHACSWLCKMIIRIASLGYCLNYIANKCKVIMTVAVAL